jgi:hypothetical protein
VKPYLKKKEGEGEGKGEGEREEDREKEGEGERRTEGREEGREGGKVQPSMLLLSPLELSLPLHLSPRLPVMGGSCSLPGCKREWLRQKGQYAGYLDTHFCILGPAHPLYPSLVSQRN